MGLVITCGVLIVVFLFWGLLGAGGCMLAGDKEGAKNLIGTGIGLAGMTPIFVIIGALLMSLMI